MVGVINIYNNSTFVHIFAADAKLSSSSSSSTIPLDEFGEIQHNSVVYFKNEYNVKLGAGICVQLGGKKKILVSSKFVPGIAAFRFEFYVNGMIKTGTAYKYGRHEDIVELSVSILFTSAFSNYETAKATRVTFNVISI